MNKIEKGLFLIIIVLAFFLRFWQLDKYPVSLNWDEISHGYNAYSLINTGKDQWGIKWPIFNFRAYGDYPTMLNTYLTIPFVYFFGLNEISIRIPSALLGFGLVIISFFFGKIIFKKNMPALFLMFITAITPWTFFSSRAVFQSTIAQFFFALGLLFLLYSVYKNTKFLLPGLASLAISMYGYHNTRIAVPLIVIIFFIIFYKKIIVLAKKKTKYFIFSIFIFLLFLLPQLINLFSNDSQARSRWVFIINPASINIINEQRNHFTGSPLIAKALYNKPLYFISEVSKNYLGFINPVNLFFNSTQNYQFNIPNNGVLLPTFLPFFYIGLIFLVVKIFKKDPLPLFLLSWFIIGLVPAVITTGDFPIIRAMTILPLPQIIITFGFIVFLSYIKNIKVKNIFTILIFIIVAFQSSNYFKNYFTSYAVGYSSSWQYGYKQAVFYIKNHYSEYDQIIVTKKYGEPHEFILFYWPWNPSSYQNDTNKIWDYHADWYWVDAFDKFQFINDWEIKNKTQKNDKKTLLITSPGNYNQNNTKLLESINFLNNTKAFDIVEIYDQK